VVLERAFPTFPAGFPPEIIAEFERRAGRGSLGNVVASGTEIIERLGDEHVRTGKPIVYTSADSVFQWPRTRTSSRLPSSTGSVRRRSTSWAAGWASGG
jgi:phosphopentomutase